MHILIVEDHPKLRENIVYYLQKKGYICTPAENGQEALETIKKQNFDVIILDINLPVMNGKIFLQKIRELGNKTPTIALTSNSLLDDKLEVFGLGADDYLTKPFELAELEARLIALGKRFEKDNHEKIYFGNFQLDMGKKRLYKKGVEVSLTQKEFLILEFLGKNLGYPKTKAEIIAHVWGKDADEKTLRGVTLEAHLSYLRKKVGKKAIKNIKAVGYVME